jgi:hypothetical protein
VPTDGIPIGPTLNEEEEEEEEEDTLLNECLNE